MSKDKIAPINGKWTNIPALLAHIAADESVSSVLVFAMYGKGPDRRMRSVHIGFTRADTALAGAACLFDAIEDSEIVPDD